MPEVNEVYSETDQLDIAGLHARREELLAACPEADYTNLSDDSLTELLAITRSLRRRSAPSTRKKSASPPPPQDNSDLL